MKKKYCSQWLFPNLPGDSIHPLTVHTHVRNKYFFKIITIIIKIAFIITINNSAMLCLNSFNPLKQVNIVIASSQMRKLRHELSDLSKVSQLRKGKTRI